MFRVELNHYFEGEGFKFSETFDNIENLCSAEEYAKNYDGDLIPENPDEAIRLEIYDEENNLISSFWLQKKFKAVDQSGNVIETSDEEDLKKAIDDILNKLRENETFSFWYDAEDVCIYTCEGEPNKNADDLECIDIISLTQLYIVELSYFINGSGWSYPQQIEKLESWINPVDYYLNHEKNLFSNSNADIIKIEIYDFDNPSCIDHCLVYKNGEIKRQLETMPFDKDGRHATGYEVLIDGDWVAEYE